MPVTPLGGAFSASAKATTAGAILKPIALLGIVALAGMRDEDEVVTEKPCG
jgi:hypothetical protein